MTTLETDRLTLRPPQDGGCGRAGARAGEFQRLALDGARALSLRARGCRRHFCPAPQRLPAGCADAVHHPRRRADRRASASSRMNWATGWRNRTGDKARHGGGAGRDGPCLHGDGVRRAGRKLSPRQCGLAAHSAGSGISGNGRRTRPSRRPAPRRCRIMRLRADAAGLGRGEGAEAMSPRSLRCIRTPWRRSSPTMVRRPRPPLCLEAARRRLPSDLPMASARWRRPHWMLVRASRRAPQLPRKPMSLAVAHFIWNTPYSPALPRMWAL